MFLETKQQVSHLQGAPAAYIPQLAKVDPSLFGISICTVDGQRFHYGDYAKPFCIQSCVKPLIYGMAVEEHGQVKVHQHIGREPSGEAFNKLCLSKQNLPQ